MWGQICIVGLSLKSLYAPGQWEENDINPGSWVIGALLFNYIFWSAMANIMNKASNERLFQLMALIFAFSAQQAFW